MPFFGSDKSVVQRTEHFNFTKLNKRPVSSFTIRNLKTTILSLHLS